MGQNLHAHRHVGTLGAQPFPARQAPQPHGGGKAVTLQPGTETSWEDSDPTKPPSPATHPHAWPFPPLIHIDTHVVIYSWGWC